MLQYKIYLITNIINGKKYVGQTKTNPPHKRWNSHINDSENGSLLPIHCAIRKYGAENFEFLVIEDWNTKEEINDAEVWWIKILDAANREFGYNIKYGGHEDLPEEMKSRISNTLKETYSSEGYSEQRREKIRQKNLEQFATEEARQKHSKIMKEYYSDPSKRTAGVKTGSKFGPYPEERKRRAAEGLRKYFAEHPEAGKAITERQKGKNPRPNAERDEKGRFIKEESCLTK